MSIPLMALSVAAITLAQMICLFKLGRLAHYRGGKVVRMIIGIVRSYWSFAEDQQKDEVVACVAKRCDLRRHQCAGFIAFGAWVLQCVMGFQITLDQFFQENHVGEVNALPRACATALLTALVLFHDKFASQRLAFLAHALLMSCLCAMALRTNTELMDEALFRPMLSVGALVLSSLCLRFRWIIVPNVILTMCSITGASHHSLLQQIAVFEVVILLMRLLLLYTAEKCLEFFTKNEVQASFGNIKQSAVSALLGMMCDAVVELDSRLCCTADSPALSTMLMRTSRRSLQHELFSEFIPDSDERERFEVALQSSASLGESQSSSSSRMMIVGLRDSIGNHVRTTVLHTPFIGADGQTHHLIGLREDVDVIVPRDERSGQPSSSRSVPAAELRPEVASMLQGPSPSLVAPIRLGRSRIGASSGSRASSSSWSGSEGPSYSRSAEVFLATGLPMRWSSTEMQAEFGLEKPKGDDGAVKFGALMPDSGASLLAAMRRALDRTSATHGQGHFVKHLGEWKLVALHDSGSAGPDVSGGTARTGSYSIWMNFDLPILENDATTPYVGLAVSHLRVSSGELGSAVPSGERKPSGSSSSMASPSHENEGSVVAGMVRQAGEGGVEGRGAEEQRASRHETAIGLVGL